MLKFAISGTDRSRRRADIIATQTLLIIDDTISSLLQMVAVDLSCRRFWRSAARPTTPVVVCHVRK
jgi:hypothetical protein